MRRRRRARPPAQRSRSPIWSGSVRRDQCRRTASRRRGDKVMASATPHILYCHCAYAQVVPVETKTAVLEHLSASGVAFEAVPDLCEMSAKGDAGLAEIAAAGATIVACYPRAVRWLFNAAGTPLPADVTVVNMREAAPADVAAALGLPAQVDLP